MTDLSKLSANALAKREDMLFEKTSKITKKLIQAGYSSQTALSQ